MAGDWELAAAPKRMTAQQRKVLAADMVAVCQMEARALDERVPRYVRTQDALAARVPLDSLASSAYGDAVELMRVCRLVGRYLPVYDLLAREGEHPGPALTLLRELSLSFLAISSGDQVQVAAAMPYDYLRARLSSPLISDWRDRFGALA